MKTIKVYNSSDILVWSGDEEGYDELRKNHLINDSDRIVF